MNLIIIINFVTLRISQPYSLTTLLGVVSDPQLCVDQKSVELVNRTYNGITFGDDEVILSNTTGEERGCVCLKGTCARKCCPFGWVYNEPITECVPSSYVFNPPVGKQKSGIIEGFNATKEFIFMIGRMKCTGENEVRMAATPEFPEMLLLNDGKLYVEIPNKMLIIYEPDKYCIDTFLEDDGTAHLDALICYKGKPDPKNHEIKSSCMLISCFFILLTVAVYAWIPELRNLPGMVLMAYLLSFFVGFLFLATMQILIMTDDITQNICLVCTFIVYFSLLSAFFWMNVMCYDIWWTFSRTCCKNSQVLPEKPHKRFTYYALYAFGVPTALTALLATLEFSKSLPVKHPLLPMIRLQGCFLYGNSKFIYLYVPIVILCVANTTFFVLTAFKIAKMKRETQMLQGRESGTHDQQRKDTQRFTVYIKLFVLMGINWILEVISSIYPEPDAFWQFFDAYNVLIGLFIFIMFVCKKKTWKMIKKRFAQVKDDRLHTTHTTNGEF